MEKNIFMIGMPSSGKSTLGKQIAKALSYEFIDLDQKIELIEGKKIADIFSLNGEEYFRKIEAEQLRKIPVNSKTIIATGGGTPCFHDGINYIKENGWSIFLDVPPHILAKRMGQSKRGTRPLLDVNDEDLFVCLESTYNTRIATYRQADITVEGSTDAEAIIWILEAELAKRK
ncbi:MAG: shikimate kinase [Spirosomataceae bacterium]